MGTPSDFDLVQLETPFMGKGNSEDERRRDARLKLLYARVCMRDCILRGEAPFASHLLYTQEGVLKDESPVERSLGIKLGFAWAVHAKRTVVYTDLGISGGMRAGIDTAEAAGRPVEYRTLYGWTGLVRAIDNE